MSLGKPTTASGRVLCSASHAATLSVAAKLLDLKLKGNYEWQTAHHGEGNSSKFNSYEYGADLSLQLPRMVIPFASYFRKKLISHYRRIGFFSTPSTTLKFSTDILNRAGFFKRRIVSGEWTYDLQTSPTSKHQYTRCRSPMNI